ncbi:hypothetical protein FRX31_022133 [Thalictrum thalictroides]|uniref:Uncharacterized protein n=1 Tax=Thalictrum thalictroides TaxID=46969 RepID=A0A7J6VU90_THATH|nr:hypothetical protein FRX31_022133 [Thalictrum thalictroides]
MVSEAVLEPSSTTPKLSFFSLPNHQVPEPPGMLTPPLQRQASIPFLWEEAPGKPRFPPSSSSSSNTTTTTNKSLARCLELPPRLILSEFKMTEMPSPTTVLDGPYVRRSASHSTVFARERLTSFEDIGSISKRSGYFGSWGKKNSMRNTRVCEGSCGISPCSSSFRGTTGGGGGEAASEIDTKVKITRIKRTGSFFRLSSSRPHRHTHHILASICGTIKQVVPLPWRSRKIKKESISI